jgi:hypothetical protein
VDSKQVEYEGMDWTHSAEDGSNGYLRWIGRKNINFCSIWSVTWIVE